MAGKRKLDARKMMEMAVDIMRHSVPERRDDGKASPLVGAVLVKDDFAKMKLAEERGLGLKSMRLRAADAGLPPPDYTWRAPYVVLSLFRSAKGVVAATDARVLAALSPGERSGWEWLASKDGVTSAEYAAALELPNRTALNHLKRLTKLGLLRKVGAGPATRYEVVRP